MQHILIGQKLSCFAKRKKKRCRRNSLSFIAENKEILRDVVITNHERLSSSAFPRLTRPWPGFEAEGPCPSMQGPGCLTRSISRSWSINFCQLDHPSLPMEEQGLKDFPRHPEKPGCTVLWMSCVHCTQIKLAKTLPLRHHSTPESGERKNGCRLFKAWHWLMSHIQTVFVPKQQ